MATPTNIEEIFTFSLRQYRKMLADNVSINIPFLNVLKRTGGMVEEDASPQIVVPLEYAENNTVSSFGRYDKLDITPTNIATEARYNWKYVAGSLTYSDQEEWFNSSSNLKIVDAIKSKLKNLDRAMRKEVGRQLQTDGTGNDGKDIQGLLLAIEDGTAWSQYAGIDSNVWPFWRNKFLNFTGSFTSMTTATSMGSIELLDAMNKMYLSLSRNGEVPNVIVTTRDIYEVFDNFGSGTKSQVVVTGDKQNLHLGFGDVLYKGIPVVHDDQVPAGTMYFANTEYFRFKAGKGKNFSLTPFRSNTDQLAKTAHMVFYGQLVLSNRSLQGVITNLV